MTPFSSTFQLTTYFTGNLYKNPFARSNYLFILSSVFSLTWLFLWQYDYITASVPVMFAFLTSLIAVYIRLQVGKSKAPLNEKLCVHSPFSVYLGWITIASISNVSVGFAAVEQLWHQFKSSIVFPQVLSQPS